MSWTAGDTITAALLNAIIPTGTIFAYGGSSAPTDWLLCNGAAIDRTTYADLFAIIGTSYGVGDGSTTFNVPDLLGRTIVGAGSGSGLTTRARGDEGGEETHQLTIAEMPAHTHSAHGTSAGSSHTSSTGANNTVTGSTGGDGAHENMPPFGVATYIIKYV